LLQQTKTWVRMVQERKFRADLYYRLNVFPMTLPPLRERRQDIPLLAHHFVQKLAGQQGKEIDVIPDDVMASLESHDWPGNVRELQNVIERGVIMTTGPVLSRQTMEPLRRDELAPVRVLRIPLSADSKTLADAERAHITAILRETNGVVGGRHGAAAQLGLPRTTLLARMQRLGISTDASRRRSARFARLMGDITPHFREDPASGLRVIEAVSG
jgi:transcriptional regulator with GAF, ATPase, and Fis domain